MTVRSIVEQSIQDTADHLICSRDDLRIVGRPELIYAMFLYGEMPECIFIMTNIIPRRAFGDGYASDLWIVHRGDVELFV